MSTADLTVKVIRDARNQLIKAQVHPINGNFIMAVQGQFLSVAERMPDRLKIDWFDWVDANATPDNYNELGMYMPPELVIRFLRFAWGLVDLNEQEIVS